MSYSEELELNYHREDKKLVFEDGVEYNASEVRFLSYLKKRVNKEKYTKAIKHIHLFKGKIDGLVISDMLDITDDKEYKEV